MNKVTLLTDDEGNKICALKEGFTKHDIRQAIQDEYSLEQVELDYYIKDTFAARTYEDGEECVRTFYLTDLVLY